MRTLVDLPDADVKWLDRAAAESGKSRAALVREAIATYRAGKQKEGIEKYFGLWKRHGFDEDGLAYERRMRAEWDRDWDAGSGDEDDQVPGKSAG